MRDTGRCSIADLQCSGGEAAVAGAVQNKRAILQNQRIDAGTGAGNRTTKCKRIGNPVAINGIGGIAGGIGNGNGNRSRT